jgi:2-polyprenyl-3-methyl-5-hydroxy-6-metoxy-1,4-benzoquinol methylase
MIEDCEEIKNCIACGSGDLVEVLDLKKQPLANSYKKSIDETELYFPLAINRCEHCFHVQLTHRVNPDLMFKDYAYVSGTAKTQLEYFEWFAEFAKEKFGTMPSTVLDIGCNDGSQLNAFQDRGAETYGVDPAENLFSTSSQRHKVVCGYFTGKEWSSKFDVITCQNAFAHNFDQLKLLQDIGGNMHNESLLFATTSQCDMILNGEFDTIYHEHLSFYNIKSIDALCKRAGLNLIDVVKSPVHGMSYIFIISKYKRAPKTIQNLIDLETKKGLYDTRTYETYAKKCQEVAVYFSGVIKRYREQGIPVVGFGAPAKGNTLMNFAGIGPDFTIDENPLKQGLYCPGVNVPIYGIEKLKELDPTKPVCFIPLAWNFYDEIVKKIKANRQESNDIYVKYFPSFEIKEEIMYHSV